MINSFTPLRDLVLLRPIQEETQRGGIYLPQHHNMDRDKRQLLCDVIAVGPKSECKPGDRVFIVEYGGREPNLDIQGVRHIVARDCDISGICVTC